MSFCGDIKKEISAAPLPHACCRKAFAYGLLQGAHAFSSDDLSIQTEHRAVAAAYAAVITALFEDVSFCEQTVPRKSGCYYTVCVADEADRLTILSAFGHSGKESSLRLNRANLDCDSCAAAYLRGLFLACGSVTDPETDYHLELSVPLFKLCGDVLTLFDECRIFMKQMVRKGCPVLYLKESEAICDCLALIGAHTASLQIYQTVMIKDIRNKVNRQTNCENANMDKTVAASSEQTRAVTRIRDHGGFGQLPPELQELAQLRLDHPEFSLRELGEASDPPISRSGVNHRMKRLMDFAASLPES